MTTDNPWMDEVEYKAYLEGERKLYAWCLETYGGFDKKTAIEEAEEFYHYESRDNQYRGLVFHDEAWHWAMMRIFGDMYWKSKPELEKPPTEYQAVSTH